MSTEEPRLPTIKPLPLAKSLPKRSRVEKSLPVRRWLLILLLLAMGTVATLGYQGYRRGKQRHTCYFNLKQIGLALHNYQDSYGTLPPRITVNANGDSLHSWRTLILPFMERSDVYELIDLTKPWNAQENAEAMKRVIADYQCPACGVSGNSCQYVAIYGSDTVFRNEKGVDLHSISDGTDHTIAVVESVKGIKHWAEPTDLPEGGLIHAVNHSESEVSSRHSGGAHLLLASGRVEFVHNGWDVNTMQQALTCSGDELIDLPWIFTPVNQTPYYKFVKRGAPYNTITIPKPPAPPSTIGQHNFYRMTIAELKSVMHENPYDGPINVSALFYLVRAEGRGRCNLSHAYNYVGDNRAAAYWLQEAAVQEGVRESDMPTVRSVLSSVSKTGYGFDRLESVVHASIHFWKQKPREGPQLTLPSGYDPAEALPLVVCLHPSFSDQGFFDQSLLTQIANRFRVAVLTLDGHEPYGPNLVVWTENYHNNYADDEVVIAKAIEQCEGTFTERANSRILVGVYGGAFVAFGSAFANPEKYSGAVALYPTVQAADGVWFDQLVPNELHVRQRYSLLGDTQRWRALMARKLKAAAYTAAAKVDLLTDDVEELEFVKEVSADSELADKLIERLSWVVEEAVLEDAPEATASSTKSQPPSWPSGFTTRPSAGGRDSYRPGDAANRSRSGFSYGREPFQHATSHLREQWEARRSSVRLQPSMGGREGSVANQPSVGSGGRSAASRYSRIGPASTGEPTSISNDTELKIGQRIQAHWASRWYEATVIELRDDGQVKIHWKNYSTNFDEFLPRSRLRIQPQ